ncbi:MAG: methylated-DNA--[protein]-cysteine S-methyltransferase [Actinobacteria bacterium]|uniref:methylated-DNA--[protein]-cysteine S-methyltransferase n=1 Tax=freshwater metagenome TaxID=449393 RepID=A0A6J6JH67_9ZZZZ|nr:methylated-DNA--[protein]-cysteine S-methyltransferase [Actinomycetota bacterium]
MAAETVIFSRGTLQAPFGLLTVVASHRGVRYITFEEDAHPKSYVDMDVRDDSEHPVVASALMQLREYLAGDRTSFDLPLDLQGTEFQVDAWNALAKIPFGSTVSYAQQAASIGRPKATRAIGSANGRNPVVIVLPCHRVVGADGSLTGFGGGLHVKSWLLDLEKQKSAQA